ncbi:retinaldehyde-binding protein 1-like [Chironomus tepperi]|uniref:retinaldehyde-binding protein 1-like n=1 Tax=Chironomus tepperi TaxID=113505 RepID=UPI00391F958B
MDQQLSDLLQRKAEVELRETELRRKQSLEQFREWLKKHPYLKRTRQDDNYLSLYLRTKKYNLNEVFKSYEKQFLFRLKCAKWFDLSDDNVVARLRSHIECGSKYIIKDYSSTEPIIYIQRFEKFDAEKYPVTDIFQSDFSLFGACLELEKAQICGFRLITDFTNVPMSVFTSVTISEVLDWARALISCPGRYKQNILINIPSIAMTFYNIVSTMLPEKLRKRLVMVKNYEELKNFMDVSILPKEFGGNCDENVYIEETLRIFDEKLEMIRKSNDYEIDVSQFSGRLHNDDVGSFRKLEID